jgi:hypothetical protein
VFAGCTSLTSVTIPIGVTSIGSGAFSGTGLSSVTIPDSVIKLGDEVFYNSSLTNAAIGNGVTSIGEEAFAFCYSLTSVTIGTNVTSISMGAFCGCPSLVSVTIPNSVTNIGYTAFINCYSLTSVTIGNSVTSIGDSVFLYCSSLTRVYFQGNAPSIDSSVFSGDTNTAYYLPGTTGWDAFSTNAGIPVALWLPQVQTSDASFGMQANQFGFNINWASGQTVVVEACTNLANPAWAPVSTNTLTSGSSYFSDPQWTNHPARFYRLRSP